VIYRNEVANRALKAVVGFGLPQLQLPDGAQQMTKRKA